MEGLNSFILDMHQAFYALLGALFCGFALLDLELYKANTTVEKRRFFVVLFSTMFLGLAYCFYDSWNGVGMFFAFEFALFVVLGLVSPKYAASFFIFLLLTRPWETFENQLMETMPRDYFYVAVLSLIGHKLAKKQFYARINLGTGLALGFAIWAFLSAFLAPHASMAIRAYLEVFSKGIIIFFLIQNCFERPSDLLPAKAAVVLAILEMGIISARNTFMLKTGGVEVDEFQRLEAIGILANSNDIAAILILALPFCIFFFLKKNVRAFLWPLSVASFCVIMALVWSSQSRGALLSVIACLCAYFVTRIKSRKALLMLGVSASLCAVVAFSFLKRRGADLDGSTSNRKIYWMAGVNMAVRNPVFGVGFWGFNDNFVGYAVGGDTGTEGKKMTAHSSWIQVMAENGFMGIALFGGLWIYGILKAWAIRREEPEYFMGLVGYGTAISFLSHGYVMYPYIILSLSITHSFLSKEEEDEFLKYFQFKQSIGEAA